MINFHKTYPEPPDLTIERTKTSGNYRTAGVLKMLKEDFHDKCYICEFKNPISINIEHFLPHKGNHNLKFNWGNLFLSCAHCNNIKSDRFDNILNCINRDDYIENKIKLSLAPPYITRKVEIVTLSEDIKTLNTATLLDQVYNGTTIMKQIESNYIREALSTELLSFTKLILEYFTTNVPSLKEYLKIKIESELHVSSAFVAFKRAIIKEDDTLKEHFSYETILDL